MNLTIKAEPMRKSILSAKHTLMMVAGALLLLASLDGFAAQRHYSLFKMGSGQDPTLLIIGGIHGDEPGGFFAPMLFSKHYSIQKGSVWVVPNLNFDSIVKNQRGIYGDMNRKFARIDPQDPDFQIVADIRALILAPEVDMVLNLHDGHGFYREKEIDELFNPKAWGQACIIDQSSMAGVQFGNLHEIAARVNNETNVLLREDVHEFNVKNTRTAETDEAMKQSLTFFAIQNGKPAFAIETSKNISDLGLKVFYQLKTIETFMNIMGIGYAKDFALDEETIRTLLADYGRIEIAGGRIAFALSNARDTLNYFPVNHGELLYSSDNPLVALIPEGRNCRIVNGNIPVTMLSTQPYAIDESLDEIVLIIDGCPEAVRLGSTVSVRHTFEVAPLDGYRVNVIGFVREGLESETGVPVSRQDIAPRFSIDNSELAYRVEVYKEDKLCGMVIAAFPAILGGIFQKGILDRVDDSLGSCGPHQQPSS